MLGPLTGGRLGAEGVCGARGEIGYRTTASGTVPGVAEREENTGVWSTGKLLRAKAGPQNTYSFGDTEAKTMCNITNNIKSFIHYTLYNIHFTIQSSPGKL